MRATMHRLVLGLVAGGLALWTGAGKASDGGPQASGQGQSTACRKWGASTRAGISGGVVTWGFVAAGTPGSPRCGKLCPERSVGALPNFHPDPGSSNERMPVALERLQPIFEAAFEAWSRAADIEFRYVGIDASGRAFADPAAAEPMIRIGAFAFGGFAAFFTAAASWAPPPNAGTLAGDILLNTNVGYQRATSAEGERLPDFPVGGGLYLHDLFLTALHEIGHAIGLGHSSDCNAVMHGGWTTPALVPTFRHGGLSDEDAARARMLYGPPKAAASKPD